MAILQIMKAAHAGPILVDEPVGTQLSDILRRTAPFFLLPCGGKRKCGKCLVWAKGALSPPRQAELALLDKMKKQAPAGFVPRLACFCNLAGSACILLPEINGQTTEQAQGGAALPKYDGNRALSCGVACDVGTTTVTMVAYRLQDGMALAAAHEMNRQGVYGADVLSRIEYANAHEGDALADVLRAQLRAMLDNVMEKGGIVPEEIERVVITGNTTMLHFVCGLDTYGIGVAPFTPVSLFGNDRPAREIFPALKESRAVLTLPSCISAYVGADITCGLLAADFFSDESFGPRLLVDVGTNGEMALLHKGRLLCCATAAGPAFEGAQIAMGMPATAGAIYRVTAAGGRLVCETIQNAPPAGICGTGLISAVNALLTARVVDGSGRLCTEGHDYLHLMEAQKGNGAIRLTADVSLTQKDIRAVQLAKAAIAAGIETMLHHAGIETNSVERLLLAGGFGSYIDPLEAAGIGLFPQALAGRTIAAGNTALQGAAGIVFRAALAEKAQALARKAQELPLSGDPVFMDAYIENMPFYEE